MYISSADLMTRNTEKRVEIATPVLDEEIRNRILNYLEIQMQDNVGSRIMNSSGQYEKIKVEEKKISSQNYFIEEAEEKTICVRNKAEEIKKEISDKNHEQKISVEEKYSFLDKLKKFFK